MHSTHFHIVTTLRELRGNELEAIGLRELLKSSGTQVTLWSDESSSYAQGLGAKIIQPFSGRIPRGGTLILLGTWMDIDVWITHTKPQRLILISHLSEAPQLLRMYARLLSPQLPPVEIVYISDRLKRTMELPGITCPLLIDLEPFQPRKNCVPRDTFVIGRHSRDVPEKHHPDDPSLYRLLVWQGGSIRLLGATCLQPTLAGIPRTSLLSAGSEPVGEFLRSLDVYFYRTNPGLHEAAGRVVLEAMACALPVVAHISGGYTDWIRHGENGLLFETQEDAWQLLRTLQHEPELRTRLGKAARESALALAGPEARQTYLDWLLGPI